MPNLAEENSTLPVNSIRDRLPSFNLLSCPNSWSIRVPNSIDHQSRIKGKDSAQQSFTRLSYQSSLQQFTKLRRVTCMLYASETSFLHKGRGRNRSELPFRGIGNHSGFSDEKTTWSRPLHVVKGSVWLRNIAIRPASCQRC